MKRAPRGADAPKTTMTPRFVDALQGQMLPARWDGHDTSGIIPRGVNVLILMDQCPTQTPGGIIITDASIEQRNEASETGCIYALGPKANAFGGGELEIGQRCYIEKYAGIKAMGADGLVYRIVDEKCIGATLTYGYTDDEESPPIQQGDAA